MTNRRHKFKPGDRAVLVKAIRPENIGRVVTVLSRLRPRGPGPGEALVPVGTPVHEIDAVPAHSYCTRVAVPPSWLEPYRPDDREAIAWNRALRKLCAPARRVKEPARQ